MKNVKVVKLVTGVEFIGRVEEDTECIRLSSTFVLVVQPVNETQFSIGLAPLSAGVLDANKGLDVALNEDQVVGLYEPTTVVLETYHRATGSIVPAVRPLIVQ